VLHKKPFFLNDDFRLVEKGYGEDMTVDYKEEIELTLFLRLASFLKWIAPGGVATG
jgi:hypothetical protein